MLSLPQILLGLATLSPLLTPTSARPTSYHHSSNRGRRLHPARKDAISPEVRAPGVELDARGLPITATTTITVDVTSTYTVWNLVQPTGGQFVVGAGDVGGGDATSTDEGITSVLTTEGATAEEAGTTLGVTAATVTALPTAIISGGLTSTLSVQDVPTESTSHSHSESSSAPFPTAFASTSISEEAYLSSSSSIISFPTDSASTQASGTISLGAESLTAGMSGSAVTSLETAAATATALETAAVSGTASSAFATESEQASGTDLPTSAVSSGTTSVTASVSASEVTWESESVAAVGTDSVSSQTTGAASTAITSVFTAATATATDSVTAISSAASVSAPSSAITSAISVESVESVEPTSTSDSISLTAVTSVSTSSFIIASALSSSITAVSSSITAPASAISTSATSTASAAATTGSGLSTANLASRMTAAYYPDWTASQLPPANVDWTLFDVVDFAFALPNSNFGLTFTQWNSETTLTNLVASGHAAGKKVRLSIGGWTGSVYFSDAVSSEQNRATFAANILATYNAFGLDGIDIDWEYPGVQGAGNNIISGSDSANFLLFLQTLRATLPPTAIISAATQVWPFADPNGNPMSDVTGFAAVLDWVLVMNYDIWGSSPTPGPNAPLSDGCGNSAQPLANAYAAVSSWTTAGMPASQIMLGIPAYGYLQISSADSLRTRSTHVILYNANGGSTNGQLDFDSLVSQGALVLDSDGTFQGAGGFVREWDTCSSTPWLRSTSSGQVVTYDDPVSLSMKAQFARQAGLRGTNMWDMAGDTSDFALTRAVRSGLGL